MGAPQLGLRARKKRATATALQEAAIELFLSRGYDATTVQDITDAAGVSQRTFFRYFPTKDAVLLTEHERREGELRDLLDRQRGRPLSATLSAAVDQLAEDIDKRRELVRVQTEVFITVPAMADRFSGHQERLAMILAEHVAEETGLSVDGDLQPRLVASQAIRAWTTAIRVWITRGLEGDLPALAAEALRLARTDPLLIDPR